jgi:hypothetical protein
MAQIVPPPLGVLPKLDFDSNTSKWNYKGMFLNAPGYVMLTLQLNPGDIINTPGFPAGPLQPLQGFYQAFPLYIRNEDNQLINTNYIYVGPGPGVIPLQNYTFQVDKWVANNPQTGLPAGAVSRGTTPTDPNMTINDLLKKVQATAAKKVDEMVTEGLDLFDDNNDGPLRETKIFSRDASGNIVYTWPDGSKTTIPKDKKWSDMSLDEKRLLQGFIDRNPRNARQDLNSVTAGILCLEADQTQTNLQNCVEPNDLSDPEKSYFADALRNALILQKLGFQTFEKNTTLGKLKLVESVDSWIKRNKIPEDKTPGNAGSLIKDPDNPNRNKIGSRSLARLRSMVLTVNINPSILNKGWKPPKNTLDYKPPAVPTPTPASRPEPVFTWLLPMRGGNVEGEVAAINNVVSSDSNAIKLATGLKELQHGGGSEYRLSLDAFDDKAVFALQKAYNELKGKLESKGKKLDSADQALIEKELADFNKLHRKVLLSVEIMKAVNDMVSKGLITKDVISRQDVLDRQHSLVKKSEDKKRKLMVILGSLGSAVAVEVGHKSAPTAPPSVPTELPRSLEDFVIE